ncbi:MAG: MraY family glycosyltransferase [Saprospiraceae bacterium]
MYNIILAFLTSLLLTYRVIPSIINVAISKKLYDIPDYRKAHTEIIPRLGGIGIFAGVLFSIILWCPFEYLGDLQYILSAFIIIFLIGAKDDLIPISPMKKLSVELFATGILVFFANIRITSFYGVLGIYQIPYIWSIIITKFVIIALINAFNLIDGVNGLAGTITVIFAFTFGYWFYKVDRMELAIVAFSTLGAVVAFLYYNFTPAKIFMGDTGSLLLGLVSAILAISFIEIDSMMVTSRFHINASPAFAIAVLIIPIFDTLRVMSVRVFKGKSPFYPDKGHIHHLLLDLGFSHLQTTFFLGIINIFVIYLVIKFQNLNINIILILILGFMMLFTGGLILLQKYKRK